MLGAALLTLTLTAQFAELATSSGGRLGVCVQSIEGGEEAQELNGRERFPMQSVYKLPIAMAVLDAVDRKTLSLEAAVTLGPADMAGVRFHSPLRDRHPNGGVTLSVRELVRAAIVDSDGVASDALYRLAGGGARISSYIHMLGITDMAIATTEREMARDARVQYRNYATPCAAVALLRTLQSGGRLSTGGRGRCC